MLHDEFLKRVNTEINLDFDLVSELYIDKFNEKIKKIPIPDIKSEATKDFENILIKTADDVSYVCVISISKDFKIRIQYFSALRGYDFEDMLHYINIINSTSNEILEEIKNEVSKIVLSEKNIEDYMKECLNYDKDIQIQPLQFDTEKHTQQGYNANDTLIKIQLGNKIFYTAKFENGTFKIIRINYTNIQRSHLDGIKEYLDIVIKTFEYYLYNKYNDNKTYKIKYQDIKRHLSLGE